MWKESIQDYLQDFWPKQWEGYVLMKRGRRKKGKRFTSCDFHPPAPLWPWSLPLSPLLTPWRMWCQMNMQRLHFGVLCDNPIHRKFLHFPSPLLAVFSHDAACGRAGLLSHQERWEATGQGLMKILTKMWSVLLHGDGKFHVASISLIHVNIA